MKVHVESRRGYRIKSRNRPFRSGSEEKQLAKREVTGEVERKPLERDVWKPEEESISTSQCVSWCQVQPRGHMKGCAMLEEVMLDLAPGCLSGHDKSMFSWKRREWSPTRMTAQGAETDCYPRQFFQDVFLWRERKNGAVAGGGGGGGWVFKICCGKKGKQYNLSVNGGTIKLLDFQWHTTVCAYMRMYILLYI